MIKNKQLSIITTGPFTSSLIRVSTAALSISLRGTLSWDRAAVSGPSLQVSFVVVDIALCGRKHIV